MQTLALEKFNGFEISMEKLDTIIGGELPPSTNPNFGHDAVDLFTGLYKGFVDGISKALENCKC